jgi:hypothetical protein
MKISAVPLVMTLAVAGLGVSQAPAALAKNAGASTKAPATHVTGEVVSTDANKLVLKTGTGEETFELSGKAATEVGSFKAGDRVVLKARNGEILSINAEGKTKSKSK